ncbi:disease resistance protein RPP13-like [Salvia hispanica]|uniref:disease resistance protein RPP13-like n=1 Tax=Salvia hispanica TaxID=49212 RepID=UPI002009BC12|nr:disease resistance protein RPP13-like [Salvia hispanica]
MDGSNCKEGYWHLVVDLKWLLKHWICCYKAYSKEVIREVANTAKEIIEYLFSPQYPSADCGSIHPTVRLSDHLRELAEELDSTVGYVVDYCKIISNSVDDVSDSPSISSTSRSAVELIVINTNGLRRLAEKIKSCGRELADEDPSDSLSITTKDVTDSTPATSNSSSRPASTTKYFVGDFAKDPSDSPSISPPTTNHDVVAGFDEDIPKLMNRITDYSSSSYLQVLPIVGMGGIGKSTLAKSIYHNPFTVKHFDIRAWLTISQDYSVESIPSQLLASLNGKVDGDGGDLLNGIEAEKHEIHNIFLRKKYLIVMDDVWSVEAWDCIRCLLPDTHNGSRIILTTRLMDVATYAAISWNIHMMRFLDDEDSWRLFQHKVFGDQDCPHELRSVGEKIVKDVEDCPSQLLLWQKFY